MPFIATRHDNDLSTRSPRHLATRLGCARLAWRSGATGPRHRARRAAGFTLVELMVAVSIAGILTAFVLPSFEAPLHKARRSDLLVAAMTVQAAQERFRSNGAAYAGLDDLGLASTSPAGHYRIAIESPTADGYTLRATAIGVQARDIACRHLTLTSNQLLVSYASGPDTRVANADDSNRRCWNL